MATLTFLLTQTWIGRPIQGVTYHIVYPFLGTSISAAKYCAEKIEDNTGVTTDLGQYDNYNAAAKACQDDFAANPPPGA